MTLSSVHTHAYRAARSNPGIPLGLSHDRGLIGGTMVLTLDGEKPVDALAPGDRIITRDAGMARIEEVSRLRRLVPLVSIAAGSLGDTRPEQDMTLPAAQAVLIRDWRAQAMFGRRQALVHAGALVDGEFIRDLGRREVVLHQLHFARPHVIYAGGLELGTGDAPAPALRPAA